MNLKYVLIAITAFAIQLPASAQTINSKIEIQGTSRYVDITGLSAKEQNGLISLYVEFSNSDREDQEAYYRVHWLDENGFPVWQNEAWKPVMVHGHIKEKVIIVSPTAKARDFKIQFSAQANRATDNDQ